MCGEKAGEEGSGRLSFQQARSARRRAGGWMGSGAQVAWRASTALIWRATSHPVIVGMRTSIIITQYFFGSCVQSCNGYRPRTGRRTGQVWDGWRPHATGNGSKKRRHVLIR